MNGRVSRFVFGVAVLVLMASSGSALAARRSVVLEDGKSVMVEDKMIKFTGDASAKRMGEAYIAGTLSAAQAASGKSTYLQVHIENGSYASRNGKIHIVSGGSASQSK